MSSVYSRLRSPASWEDKITVGSRSRGTSPNRFGRALRSAYGLVLTYQSFCKIGSSLCVHLLFRIGTHYSMP